jgi:AcrR family transcriptional regulator
MPQPKSKSRRLTANARREQLLDVTTQLVGDDGFRSVTIESVARSAGITRPIVYEHFGDLSGLLEAVVEREMARALTQVSETALAELTEDRPIDLMLESLSSFLHAVQSHPTTWRLVLTPVEGAPAILRERIEHGRAKVLAQLADAVRPLSTKRKSPDAELTAHILSAISDEYARLILADPKRFPPDRLLKHARWFLEQAEL